MLFVAVNTKMKSLIISNTVIHSDESFSLIAQYTLLWQTTIIDSKLQNQKKKSYIL